MIGNLMCIGEKRLASKNSDPLFESQEESEAEEDFSGLSLFDSVIGHIEDILIEDRFMELQNKFLDKYWEEFDDTEENKLSYTDIFQEYVSIIEGYIENKLKEDIPDFNLNWFLEELKKRRKELEGEVFDMLYTLSDFLAFKEMVLDYRNVREGRTVDLSSGILVKAINQNCF